MYSEEQDAFWVPQKQQSAKPTDKPGCNHCSINTSKQLWWSWNNTGVNVYKTRSLHLPELCSSRVKLWISTHSHTEAQPISDVAEGANWDSLILG